MRLKPMGRWAEFSLVVYAFSVRLTGPHFTDVIIIAPAGRVLRVADSPRT